MAVLTIPRKVFEKDIGKVDEKMDHKIAMFGTPIDGYDDENVNIEVFPNRPDLLSYQNFKYAILCYFGKIKPRDFKLKKSGLKIIVDKSVGKVRPYSMAAIVKNCKFDDERIKEIMNFQEKFHATTGRNRKKMAMGYYVLDRIKFPVKYTTDDPKKIIFEPLEMPQKMNALQILSRHPTGREYGNQLEGFDKFPVYYDSTGQVLSLPPIINSDNLGKITEDTKNILIECSGSDLNTLKKSIIIAVTDLLNANPKAEAYSVEIDYGNKKESISLDYESIKINLTSVNKLIGINLKESEIPKLLEKMGHKYKNKTVYYPAFRTDILHEVDIIEDIAIAYGYDNLVPQIPQISTIGEISKKEIIKKRISDILTNVNLIETSSLHLTTKDFQLKAGLKENSFTEVENSKTDFNILRNDLSHYLLRILSENLDVEYPQEIFEQGVVFDSNLKESEHLAIALTPSNFTKLKQTFEYLARMLNLENKIFLRKSDANNYSIEGRIASINLNNKEIGFICEVHPQILKNFKIKTPVALLELNLTEIFKEFK